MTMLTCKNCGKRVRRIGGRQIYCKKCKPIMAKIRSRAYTAKHIKEITATANAWRAKNPERNKKNCQRWKDRNIEYYRDYQREYSKQYRADKK